MIEGSIKLQKKLFFKQPTFEGALELDVIDDRSTVYACAPDLVSFMNPLIVDSRPTDLWERDGELVRRITKEIVLQWMKSGHGSWERMYGGTDSRPQLRRGTLKFEVDVEVLQILNHGAWAAKFRKVGERLYCGEWKWETGPMRTLMRKVESLALAQDGVSFSWASAKLKSVGVSMNYRVYEKMIRLAKKQNAEEWSQLEVFDSANWRAPDEKVIDEALTQAELAEAKAESVGEDSEDSESEGNGIDGSDLADNA